MNILIEGMSRELGGMEAFVMSVFRNLDHTRYQIDFIKYDKTIAFEDEVKEQGSVVYSVTPRNVNAVQSKKELQAIFQKKDYQVFWSNKTTISNINALKAAYDAKVPVRILHSHSTENRGTGFTYFMHRKNMRPAAKYATTYLACSKEAAVWMFGKHASEAKVLINGIDVKKYVYSTKREEEMRAKLEIGNRPVVGHVGRFSKEKNHDFIFQIFAEILKKEPEALLLLCGGGDLLPEYKKKAEDLGLGDKVRFLGVRKDVPDVLQVMNVFLFPSLFEGYPISLIEAQAAGVPVFASKTVIPEEIKITEEMHFISLEESPKVWAEAAVKSLHLPKRSDVETFMEHEASLDKMMKTVTEMINTRR